MEGGVVALEITFTVPGAHTVIEELSKRFSRGEILLGAGTVLDAETARIAMLSGAQYIISPSVNPDTARICNRYQMPYMPGIATPTEAVQALECGCDVLKVFPGESLGPTFVKAVKAPLPQAQLMPTGGVAVNNVAEWIKAGAVAVGVGGHLIAGAKTGDFKSISTTARQFLEEIRKARAS
jgi:2-dehydro-3-deoxyphosphogluconate aldolase/(4S)-4-hydroxy-2-oxoglutarate aldolase